MLADPKTELWLSPVSVWEVLTLCQKGRLNLAMDPQAWIASAQSILPTHEAPLTFEAALATTQVQLPHNDPADRFLAATARVFDLTLVTADQHLIGGKGFRVLAVR
jgi:PIN domain nuclease of toxin-antitoxin system